MLQGTTGRSDGSMELFSREVHNDGVTHRSARHVVPLRDWIRPQAIEDD